LEDSVSTCLYRLVHALVYLTVSHARILLPAPGGACLAPGLSIILGAGARALAQAIVTEVFHDLQ
jgi:hypothetical protein